MTMQLKVILPHQIFFATEGVHRIVAETRQGALGLLPRRLDCVTALVPGILTYSDQTGEKYVALDGGVLVKRGFEVLVAVRRAISGSDLADLRKAIEVQFMHLDEQEKNVRLALARLESEFVRRFMELKRYG